MSDPQCEHCQVKMEKYTGWFHVNTYYPVEKYICPKCGSTCFKRIDFL